MRKLKKKEYENLSDTNIQKVINLLYGDKPISKKEACSILNIAYNTTRLQRIIDDFEETQAYRSKRKSQNKGKAATRDEVAERLLDSYPATQSQKSQRGYTGHLDLLSPSSSELEYPKKEREDVTISRMSALLKILLLER